MMLLAIEALIRIMIYVRNIWGDTEENIILFLLIALIVSILVLCFCILTLMNKFVNLMTYNIYICFALILVAMIVIFPFVSLIFEASLQVISVWGCIAAALYGLWKYNVPNKEVVMSKKELILKNILHFCVILTILMLFLVQDTANPRQPKGLMAYLGSAIYKYNKLHPGFFSEFSPTETVDITSRLDISDSEYIRTGVASVVLKNKNYSLQYDVETLFYHNRGVPWLGLGAYIGISLEDYKKELTKFKTHCNSPDLDSPYDGIGDVFFRKIVF
jgi:hypothetical protein